MKLTFYGHSCFLIETGGKRLLTDPFISGNPLAQHIDVNSLRCDYIFPSHAHGDHIGDMDAVMANNPEATIVAIADICGHFQAKSYKCHPMNKGGWWSFDFGRVKMVNAAHSSSFPDGSYGGEPVGFVFDTPEGVLYFAGDTALTMDMHLIPMTCPPLDMAVLPIGSNFTMDYRDALIASDFIRCNRIVGCHYDTFGYIKIDHEQVQNAFMEKGKEIWLPAIGEAIQM